MRTNKKEYIKDLLVILGTLVVSFVFGIIFDDYIFGPLTLIFGFLNCYYMAIGKWENYVYGILFTITYTYICAVNGLYGWLIVSMVYYVPIQIYGIVNWFKNRSGKEVQLRSFTIKNSLIICISIILGSVILGFLLSLIPGQNLAFLDSTSQMLNIFGVLLVVIRFRECWYIWFTNNIIDLIIWVIRLIEGSAYSQMALIVSVMYLVMNIIGVVSWVRMQRKQKEDKN